MRRTFELFWSEFAMVATLRHFFVFVRSRRAGEPVVFTTGLRVPPSILLGERDSVFIFGKYPLGSSADRFGREVRALVAALLAPRCQTAFRDLLAESEYPPE